MKSILCNCHRINSADVEENSRNANVVHNLLENEEPDGVPHPASVLAKQTEGVKTNSDASYHWDKNCKMHSNVDPFENADGSRHAQVN